MVNHESRDIRSLSHPISYFLKVERLSFNGQRWKPCCIYEIGQKKRCCGAGWSFWSFLYWFLVPKTLTMYKIKRIYTVYILLIIHNNAKIKKVSWVFLNWASPAAHYLMGCWLYLFLSTQIVRCLTKSNRKYVRKNIFVGFQFLLRPSAHVFGTLEANIDSEFEGFPGWNFISRKLKKLPGKYRIQLCDHLALTFCLPSFKFITFYKL